MKRVPCYRCISLLLLMFSYVSSSPSAFAQLEWQPANNGIWGADVFDITFTPSGTPLITTAHGLYRYEAIPGDEFDSYEWKRLEKKMFRGNLERSSEGRIFCQPVEGVLSYTGLYYSDDSGSTWEQFGPWEFEVYNVLDDKTIAGFLPIKPLNRMGFQICTEDGECDVRSSQAGSGKAPERLLHDSDWNFYSYSKNSSVLTLSVDTGRTWLTTITPYNFMQIGVIRPGQLLGATSSGIYRSVDTGQTWQLMDSLWVDELVSNPNGVWYASRHISRVEADQQVGLLRSLDDGETWIPTSSHSSRMMAIAPTGEFWSTGWRTVYRSLDDGKRWEETATGLTNTRIQKILFDYESSTFYALSGRESLYGNLFAEQRDPLYYTLYRSTNNGDSWIPVADSVCDFLTIDSVGGLYAVRDSLYYRPYIYERNNGDEVITDTTYQLITEQFLYRSPDYGDTWQPLPMSSPIISTRQLSGVWPVIASNNNGLIAVNYSIEDSSGYREERSLLSADAGATWEVMEHQLPVPDSAYVNVMYISDDNEFFLSAWWFPNPLTNFLQLSMWREGWDEEYRELVEPVKLRDSMTTRLFYVDYEGRLYLSGPPSTHLLVSSDRGEEWNVLFESDDQQVLASSSVTSDGTLFVVKDAVYRSTDGGESWDSLSYNVPIASGYNGRLAAVTHYDRYNSEYDFDLYHYFGLRLSFDNGTSWQEAEGIMKYAWVSTVIFDSDNNLFVGTEGDGLFRSGKLIGTVQSERLEDRYGLSIYPTPSVSDANVVLTLPHRATLHLDLYDATGRRIRTISHGEVEAGEHRFTFNIEDLSAGMYFCRLVIDGKVQSVPFIVH